MKLLFVGNSHIGALKQGLELAKDDSRISLKQNLITFCGTVGGNGLISESNLIFVDPKNENYEFHQKTFKSIAGAEEVNFLNFNGIFLVGGSNPLDFRQFFDFDKEPNPFSYSLVYEIVQNIMRATFEKNQSCSKVFISMLNSGINCYWIPNPCEPFLLNARLKSVGSNQEMITFGESNYYKFLDDLSWHNYYKLLYKTIYKISEKIFKNYGGTGVILPRPDLLTNSLMQTKIIYSRGSRHFANETKQPDWDLHMNANYGNKIILSAINKFNLSKMKI